MNQETTKKELNPTNAGITIALVLLAVLLSANMISTPKPVAADAPGDQFSAERTVDTLKRIMPNENIHPVGTEEHALVRQRIVDEFTSLGIDVAVEESTYATPWRTWTRLFNVLAKLPGKSSGKMIVAMAHYDSVSGGPGIADDGHGVAALIEMARMLKAGPQPEHDILFLITDGEEMGLLGAEVFAEKHADELDKIAAVINLEARGNTGISYMFQTGPRSGFLVDAYAENVTKKTTSSLFPAIYKTMPNDTDLSVFIERDIPGLNLAFIGRLPHYHSPLDNYEYLDHGSVQHQGESAYAVLKAIAFQKELPEKSGDPVFFDFAGLFVFSWPGEWTMIIAIVNIVLVLCAMSLLLATKTIKPLKLLWGFIQPVLTVALAAGLGYGSILLINMLNGTSAGWPDAAWSYQITLVFAVILSGLLLMWIFRPIQKIWGLWSGTMLLLAIFGVIAAIYLPGGSYLFIVPSFVGAILLLIDLMLKPLPIFNAIHLAVRIPMIVMAYFMVFVACGAMLAMGLQASYLMTVPLALLLCTVLPHLKMFPGKVLFWGVVISFVIFAIFLLAAGTLPVYTKELPETANILFLQDADVNTAEWKVNASVFGLKDILLEKKLVEDTPVTPYAFYDGDPYMLAGAAPVPAVDAPVAEVVDVQVLDEGVQYTVKLSSPRGAPVMGIVFPAGSHPTWMSLYGLKEKAVEEYLVTETRWKDYYALNVPAEGCELVFVMKDTSPFSTFVFDRSWDLPAEAKKIIDALPDYTCPKYRGHTWIITRALDLSPDVLIPGQEIDPDAIPEEVMPAY